MEFARNGRFYAECRDNESGLYLVFTSVFYSGRTCGGGNYLACDSFADGEIGAESGDWPAAATYPDGSLYIDGVVDPVAAV